MKGGVITYNNSNESSNSVKNDCFYDLHQIVCEHEQCEQLTHGLPVTFTNSEDVMQPSLPLNWVKPDS